MYLLYINIDSNCSKLKYSSVLRVILKLIAQNSEKF